MSGVNPYVQARSDLDSTVGVQIATAENLWNAGNYPGAVAAFQAAGQQAAGVIGPEIDAVGYANATQKFTQQAWSLNGNLATIAAATASQADALAASALVQKMMSLYNQAIAAGTAAANPPSSGAVPVALMVVGFGVATGLVLGLVEVMRRGSRPSRAKTRRASTAPTRRMSTAATRRA